jgi:pimeloyl-ACP methyl ester carboxylesterase
MWRPSGAGTVEPVRTHIIVPVVVAIVAAGTAAPTIARAAAGSDERLRWGACPVAEGAASAELRCAGVSVPLDYRRPAGRHITITISRRAATDPAHRRGVLVVDPGGPGVRGLAAPGLVAADPAQARVAERYDLVGFDARGSGGSRPVDCGLNDAQVRQAQLPWPQPGGFPADVATARTTAEACTARAGALLPYLTTAATARDLDAIRTALGEPVLSYLGVSYGTYLGGVYATLFPARVGRFVFDSSMDPDGPAYEAIRATAPAVEQRIGEFAAWTAGRNSTYHLGGTPAAVYDELLALTDDPPDAQPVRSLLYAAAAAPGTSMFAPAAGVVQYLAGRPGAPDGAAELLRQVTAVASDGSATASAMLSVICGDGGWPAGPEHYRWTVAADAARYPATGGGLANIRPCAFWPKAAEPRVTIAGGSRANVLMLQNERDPVTPYGGALRLRRVLGPEARMVSLDAAGHGAGGNPCAVAVALAWLVDGDLPAHDTTCPAPVTAS